MFDTFDLVNDAYFCTELSKNLFWVPFNILGKSHLTHGQIEEIVRLNPYEKRNQVKSLYEVLQLFELSQFEDREDNKYRIINGKRWEFHKKGFQAVQDNFGCCSDIAAWANFFLNKMYNHTGYLGFQRPDGTGHVLNYIYIEKRYYVFDFSAHVYERKEKSVKETGKRIDYIRANQATAVCFCMQDLSDFIKFHNRLQRFGGYDFFYYVMPPTDEVPAVSIEKVEDVVNMYYSGEIHVLYKPSQYNVLPIDIACKNN